MRQRSGLAALGVFVLRGGRARRCRIRRTRPCAPPARRGPRVAVQDLTLERDVFRFRFRARDLPVPRARGRTRHRRGLRRRGHRGSCTPATEAERAAARPAAADRSLEVLTDRFDVPRPALHRRHRGRDPRDGASPPRPPSPDAAVDLGRLPQAPAQGPQDQPPAPPPRATCSARPDPSTGVFLALRRRRRSCLAVARRRGPAGSSGCAGLGHVDGRRRRLAAVRPRTSAEGGLLVSRAPPERRDGDAARAVRPRAPRTTRSIRRS